MLESSKKVIDSVVDLKSNLAKAVDSSSDVELNLDNVASVVDGLSAELTSVNNQLTSKITELNNSEILLAAKKDEFEQLQKIFKKDLTNKCTWLGDETTSKKVENSTDVSVLIELKTDVDKRFNEKFDLSKIKVDEDSENLDVDSSKFDC